MDEQAASPPRRFPWPLAGRWAAALAGASGLIPGIQGERAERRHREGTGLASQAAEWASRARAASDTADGADLLEAAGAAGASRAGLRVDLASPLLRAETQEHLPRARSLGAQAWDTPDLPDPLGARSAQDRGAVGLLAGSAQWAQLWYERAAAWEPGDPGEPLEALRRSAHQDGAGAR